MNHPFFFFKCEAEEKILFINPICSRPPNRIIQAYIYTLVPRQALAARKAGNMPTEETQQYDATQAAEACHNGLLTVGAGGSPVAAPSDRIGEAHPVSRSLARDFSSAALDEKSGIVIGHVLCCFSMNSQVTMTETLSYHEFTVQ